MSQPPFSYSGSSIRIGCQTVAGIPVIYNPIAAAIANYKPTHRQVINGIAPHVLDEQWRPRRKQNSTRTWCEHGGLRSSPLRVSVFTLDEQYITHDNKEQPTCLPDEKDITDYRDEQTEQEKQEQDSLPKLPNMQKKPCKKQKSAWYNSSQGILKTIVIKFKFSPKTIS